MGFVSAEAICRWVFQASLSWLCFIGATYAWTLVLFLCHRRRALYEEHRLLNAPLPADTELPYVLVQIPTFNEGQLVCRIAAAVAQLDWPRNRLHVQILDDSTDGSVRFAEKAIATLRQHNIDAALLRRPHRYGFKAGALAAGLDLSDHEFVVLFDADYQPASDFLKRCIRPLLSDPTLALVQARSEFVNAKESLVTRLQQRLLDAHFAIEQAARSWSGHIMPFNGTCGIWRRVAIDEAGGWQGDTLTEDLDLSYRAQLLGWRASFLTSVAVVGELPTSFHTWKLQQFRWKKGAAEVARKMLPSVICSDLGFSRKLMSILHLGGALFGPMVGLIMLSGILDLTVGDGFTVGTKILLILFALELLAAQSVILLGQRVVRRTNNVFLESIKLQVMLCALGYLHFATWRANLEVWLGRKTQFVRTAKNGHELLASEIGPVTAFEATL